METRKLGKKQRTYKPPKVVRNHYTSLNFIHTGTELVDFSTSETELLMYRYSYSHKTKDETMQCTAFANDKGYVE